MLKNIVIRKLPSTILAEKWSSARFRASLPFSCVRVFGSSVPRSMYGVNCTIFVAASFTGPHYDAGFPLRFH
jgi:hypothetical protein